MYDAGAAAHCDAAHALDDLVLCFLCRDEAVERRIPRAARMVPAAAAVSNLSGK